MGRLTLRCRGRRFLQRRRIKRRHARVQEREKEREREMFKSKIQREIRVRQTKRGSSALSVRTQLNHWIKKYIHASIIHRTHTYIHAPILTYFFCSPTAQKYASTKSKERAQRTLYDVSRSEDGIEFRNECVVGKRRADAVVSALRAVSAGCANAYSHKVGH